jgi:hypothetical protein
MIIEVTAPLLAVVNFRDDLAYQNLVICNSFIDGV